jgi:hypothetical protein
MLSTRKIEQVHGCGSKFTADLLDLGLHSPRNAGFETLSDQHGQAQACSDRVVRLHGGTQYPILLPSVYGSYVLRALHGKGHYPFQNNALI